MKPYGARKHDMETCPFGCCAGQKGPRNGRPKKTTIAADRAAKKRARREGNAEVDNHAAVR